MAKKNKRTARNSRPSKVARRPRSAEEFNPDYTDIKKDLKNIGLLAGIFLAVLIILSFIL
ncbi:MAG: hypothetical protein DRI32_04570 [Chloroflexi bacterium]|nr:MAG: hypothetical protein DRI32_04570 [Chloroflexota bacterium]